MPHSADPFNMTGQDVPVDAIDDRDRALVLIARHTTSGALPATPLPRTPFPARPAAGAAFRTP